jgi:hypothetical protein
MPGGLFFDRVDFFWDSGQKFLGLPEPFLIIDVLIPERMFGPVRPSPFDTPSRVSAQLPSPLA